MPPTTTTMQELPSIESSLPTHKDLFYAGAWHSPSGPNSYKETLNPGTGKPITSIAQATAQDVDTAVTAAHEAFQTWRALPFTKRAAYLRKAAEILRKHAKELAMIDAYNTGNPVARMLSEADVAAYNLEYYAGLAPMIRGETLPQASGGFHYTVREPLGVVARIIASNHPVLFGGARIAAPLMAGNTVVVKPPDQAPLSNLRLAELLKDVFPPGVYNVLPGGPECGKALSTHPLVAKVTLIGSVPTGKAIQKAAADTLKLTHFELGGKNAFIAFPDSDMEKLVEGVSRGMNFTWAGQSCGSTSRVFLHESHHDEVLKRVVEYTKTHFKPGVPTELATTMGPVVSKVSQDRVLSYIASGKEEGATLMLGGNVPTGRPELEGGYFIEPTIFADVKPHMRIAKEEIFGPVMSVFKWSDEEELMKLVNDTRYGLTAAVYTQNLGNVHRIVPKIEAGYIWVNQVSTHFIGVPFGGYKESGNGREECLEELLSFTQTKSVHIKFL